MRIISQDGTIDIPYEQCVIQRFKEKIYFLNKNLTGVEQLVCDMEMASYSTEEKAEKSMEMLHDSYNNFDWIKTTGFSDELKVVCKQITKEDFKALTSPYFQFPKDEDVEVENET